MAIQLKEFTTACGNIRLQFIDLLGYGAIDPESRVLNLLEEEYVDLLKKAGAVTSKTSYGIDYHWKIGELTKARKFKNMLNKKAREIKFSKEKALR